MPSSSRPPPHRSPPPGSSVVAMAKRLWAGLQPRLGATLSSGWQRCARFIEGEEGRKAAASAASAVLDRLRAVARTLLRRARAHDTVPNGTLRAAINRYEERMARAERRRAEQKERRQRQEADRQAREKRYSEKSAIYLD